MFAGGGAIAIAYNVSPVRALGVAFNLDAGLRPGWQVLGAGLAVVLLDRVRARWNRSRVRGRAVAAE